MHQNVRQHLYQMRFTLLMAVLLGVGGIMLGTTPPGAAKVNQHLDRPAPSPEIVTAPEPAPSPRPPTGIFQVLSSRSRLAPLQIRTPAGDEAYFIKVVDDSTNATLMTLFVPSGETFDTKVPLGSLRIRYAVGENWFGPEKLFGPDTSFNAADKTFDFSEDSEGYKGYTVELIRQIGGNLDTRAITAADF
jgi:hypothetical protein